MNPEHLEQLRRFAELQASVPPPEEYKLEADEFLDLGWRKDWAELLTMSQTLPIAELLEELESLRHALELTDYAHQLTAAQLADAASETLKKAADAWQQGEWANAPRRDDRIVERLANGQYVADWLRERADSKSAQTENKP